MTDDQKQFLSETMARVADLHAMLPTLPQNEIDAVMKEIVPPDRFWSIWTSSRMVRIDLVYKVEPSK
jgi:hypothetical protein